MAKPQITDLYKTVDLRALVRCYHCRCFLQRSDIPAHSDYHRKIERLQEALERADAFAQPALFDTTTEGNTDGQADGPPPF